jgi:hypothetical protein
MKFEEVETGSTKDGVIAYRWKDDEELAKAMAVKQALDDRKKMALSERIVTNQRPKSIDGPIGTILREEVKK